MRIGSQVPQCSGPSSYHCIVSIVEQLSYDSESSTRSDHITSIDGPLKGGRGLKRNDYMPVHVEWNPSNPETPITNEVSILWALK